MTGDEQPRTSDIWRSEEEPVASLPHEQSPTSASQPVWREEEGTPDSFLPSRPTSAGRDIWESATATRTLESGEAPPEPLRETAETTNEEAAPRSKGPRKSRRPRRSKTRKRILVGTLSFLLLGLAAESTVETVRLASGLADARSGFQSGAAAFRDGDWSAAAEAMRAAKRGSEQASAATGRPVLATIAAIPGIGSDAVAIEALSNAGTIAADAGLDAIEGASDFSDGEPLFSLLFSAGELNLETIDEVTPILADIERRFSESAQILAGAPEPNVDAIHERFEAAATDMAAAAETARDGTILMRTLPELFGGEGRRQYLLAFQAIGEARGTGGVVGAFGVLDAKDGRISIGPVRPYGEIVPDPIAPVPAPTWFEKSYGPQFSTRQWQQANLSPNFPVTAEVFLRMYEATAGRSLDGVIAMDPIALEEMMTDTQQITVPGSDPIGKDEVVRALLVDSYVDFDTSAAQDEFLGAIVEGYWSQFEEGSVDGAAFTQGLADAVRSQHLKVYTRADETQALLTDLDATGAYEKSSSNTLMVFHNNYSVNKVDYFLRRKVNTRIKLDGEGRGVATSVITVRNEAPDGPPSLLLGPGIEGDEPGTNRMVLSTLLPQFSEPEKVLIDGNEAPLFTWNEENNPVTWNLVELGPGEEKTITVRYRLFKPFVNTSAGIRFALDLVPQTTVNPDQFELSVAAPPGFAFAKEVAGPDPVVQEFTDSGELNVRREYRLNLVRR